jgi:signal transduction histidine kinase
VKLPAAASRLVFKPKRYTTFVMMLVIWAGVAGSLFAAISIDLRNKDFMRGNAETIAQSIPLDQLKSLKGNDTDSSKQNYRNIKDLLTKVHNNDQDLRFIYLMGGRKDQVFYYADSEAPNSEDYVPPGQINYQASHGLKEAFSGSKTFVEGPNRNHRGGFWMSAVAPVVDEKSGRTLAVVRIDRSATSYYTQIITYALVPLLLAAIPLAGLIRDRKLEAKQYEITQLKNQFVSIASHELRSPLTGMLWAIQSLLKNSDNMNKKQQSLLNDMFRSAESSLATVNEILDLSIFERGQANKLQREIVDLPLVLREVCATLKLGAKEKQLKLEFESWPEHAFVLGDVAALKRAYMNILANAIKYTAPNTDILINYRLANHEHIISIKDQGIGIPLKEQPKVMQGYYRATNATAVQAHGTGLGLWVTRMVIEQHHGRLWLNSRINHGTTIFTALPATNLPLEKPKED